MEEVYLLLGSNRGDRAKFLSDARAAIGASVGELQKQSAVFESEPWGFGDAVPFYNQVLVVRTLLKPGELLRELLRIETSFGRIRPGSSCCSIPVQGESVNQAYAGRTLDVDILFIGTRLVFTDTLMVPHPRIHERRFTLVPLNEVAPDLVHPVLKKTIFSLLAECTDTCRVWPASKNGNRV